MRYTAKPNITPDDTFEKELKDIKLDAEQSLVDALTRFHKRRLEGQKKKQRAFSQPNVRRNKFATRQPFNDTQSTNHIVNHNNVNFLKDMLVREKLHFEGFDYATQPQNHIGSPCGLSLLYVTRSEVGSRKSEVGSRKSEVGSRKSEVGSRKSEVPPRLS